MQKLIRNPFSFIIILEILAISISVLTKNPYYIIIISVLASMLLPIFCVGFYKNAVSLVASILLVVTINYIGGYLQQKLQLFGWCYDLCGITYIMNIPILVISSIVAIKILNDEQAQKKDTITIDDETKKLLEDVANKISR